MSDETKNQEGTNAESQQTPEATSQPSKEDYLIEQKRAANAEAKDYRLKNEELQQKLDGIEKAKNEAELDATEKLKVRDQELTELKASIERDKLTIQYVDLIKAKGFSEKVAKLGIPKDLTADNMLDSVKKFDKEYADLKTPDVKKEEPANPFASVQPSDKDVKVTGPVTGTKAFKSLYNKKD